jgi:Bifunctional DNA primase/polymerase, N-terminal
MQPESNRDCAITLARAGIAVFPCGADKKPLGKWRDISSCDARVVAELWEAHPEALPGIDLAKADLVVLDGDRHGGPDGRKALRDVLLSQDDFDGHAAPTVFTPGGGVHVYFRQNGATTLTNARGNLPKGVDVRGAGGLVICPCAKLPDGRCYRPVPGTADLISAYQAGTIPPVPQGIVELIQAPKLKVEQSEQGARNGGTRERAYAEAALDGCVRELSAAAPGARNETLNRIAYHLGRMVARGWISHSEVETALISAMQCNGYIAEKGIKATEATLGSGLLAGEKEPHDNLTDRTRSSSIQRAEAQNRNNSGGRSPSQADILIGLAQSAELFHTPDGRGFADLEINGHRETWSIRSKNFRRWLARRFFETTRGAPNSEALQSALNVIEANAHFDSPERVVHVRVGGLGGRIYLDLADETWRAVEIDATGWRVIDNAPVRFRRAAGMGPIPTPVPGGSVEMLRSFLNLKTDGDFALVVAWALACLRDRGPYPVMVLSGEQGSAKSTFSAVLRALLDPNTAPLRALPREDRDLFIAASNGHVLCFDNVSGLPAWISDTLCRLATGGGFAVRQLYSDQDEVLFDATRPVILNGIEDIVTRPDLADRAIFLTLEAIPEERRQPEEVLWAAFKGERPHILGALLDAAVQGLKRLPDTHLSKLPRMADFALWASACEPALWPPGTFWSAYCGNRDEAVEGVIDADPVAAAVRATMMERTVWTGTASELLGVLSGSVDERIAKAKTWPDSPRALAGRLRRAATFLRKIGIEIGFERHGRGRTRLISITTNPSQPRAEDGGPQPSAPSASSAQNPNSMSRNGLAAPEPRGTVASDADGVEKDSAATVRANPLKSNGGTGADDADANFPVQSVREAAGAGGWKSRI